ncbi:MAG: hypothetical protein ACAH80_01990 [Alphaproteobacteria bacterium]
MAAKQTIGKIFVYAGYGLMGLAALGALFALAVNGYAFVEDLNHGRAEGWEIIWVLGLVVLLGGITAGIGYGLLALGRKLGG